MKNFDPAPERKRENYDRMEHIKLMSRHLRTLNEIKK